VQCDDLHFMISSAACHTVSNYLKLRAGQT